MSMPGQGQEVSGYSKPASENGALAMLNKSKNKHEKYLADMKIARKYIDEQERYKSELRSALDILRQEIDELPDSEKQEEEAKLKEAEEKFEDTAKKLDVLKKELKDIEQSSDDEERKIDKLKEWVREKNKFKHRCDFGLLVFTFSMAFPLFGAGVALISAIYFFQKNKRLNGKLNKKANALEAQVKVMREHLGDKGPGVLDLDGTEHSKCIKALAKEGRIAGKGATRAQKIAMFAENIQTYNKKTDDDAIKNLLESFYALDSDDQNSFAKKIASSKIVGVHPSVPKMNKAGIYARSTLLKDAIKEVDNLYPEGHKYYEPEQTRLSFILNSLNFAKKNGAQLTGQAQAILDLKETLDICAAQDAVAEAQAAVDDAPLPGATEEQIQALANAQTKLNKLADPVQFEGLSRTLKTATTQDDATAAQTALYAFLATPITPERQTEIAIERIDAFAKTNISHENLITLAKISSGEAKRVATVAALNKVGLSEILERMTIEEINTNLGGGPISESEQATFTKAAGIKNLLAAVKGISADDAGEDARRGLLTQVQTNLQQGLITQKDIFTLIDKASDDKSKGVLLEAALASGIELSEITKKTKIESQIDLFECLNKVNTGTGIGNLAEQGRAKALLTVMQELRRVGTDDLEGDGLDSYNSVLENVTKEDLETLRNIFKDSPSAQGKLAEAIDDKEPSFFPETGDPLNAAAAAIRAQEVTGTQDAAEPGIGSVFGGVGDDETMTPARNPRDVAANTPTRGLE